MSNATVLVVDDDPATVSFLETALSVEGYEVLAALNEAALRLAHEQQPNVILLDLMMPGMDGVEVSKRLRANPVTAHIPIIAMSASDRLVLRGSQMQVDDKLPKPFELRRLYELVARWGEMAPEMRGGGLHPTSRLVDGVYPATLRSVRQVSNAGGMPSWIWDFTARGPDGTTHDISQGTAANFSVTAYPRAWAEALGVDVSLVHVGADGGLRLLHSTQIDLGQFSGRRCRLVLEVDRDPDGDPVPWITNILPPLPGQRP